MENYVVIKQVGKGSFGTAEVVEDKREKNRYILKKTRLARQPELQREASIQEMFLQSAVHHRNIVRCREKWMDKAFVANLVLEYCPQGELASTFQTRFRHQYFEEDAILDMFVQVASALLYLHENNIVHRDIKPQNIFVRADNSLAIGDFGLGRLPSSSKELAEIILGTPQYMAPEVVKGKPIYSTKSDIWAVGVMFYEISALKPPFSAFNMPGLISKITKAQAPQLPSVYSKEWKQLVHGCLQKDPSRRPTLQELLGSPFLQAAVERVDSRYGPADCSVTNLEIAVTEMQQIMRRCKERSNAGLLPTPGKARMPSARKGPPKSRQSARAEQKAKVERLPPAAPGKKAPLPSIPKPKSVEPKKAAPPTALPKTSDTGAKKAPSTSLAKSRGSEEKPPATLPSLQTIEEKKAITDQRAAAALAKVPRPPPKPQPHVARVPNTGETRHKKQQLPPLNAKRPKTGKQPPAAKPADPPIHRKAAVPSFKTKGSTTSPAAGSISPSKEAGGLRRDRYGMVAPSTPAGQPPGSSRQREASKPGTAASGIRSPGPSPTSKPRTAGGGSSRQTFVPKSPSRGGVIISKPRLQSTRAKADGAGLPAASPTAATKVTAAREDKQKPAASGAQGHAKPSAAGRNVHGIAGSGVAPLKAAQDKQQKQGRGEQAPNIQGGVTSGSAESPGASSSSLPGLVAQPTVNAKPQRPTVVIPGNSNNVPPSPGKALAGSVRSRHLPPSTRPRTSAVAGARGILRATTGQLRPGTAVHDIYIQSHLASPVKKKPLATGTSEAELERLFTPQSRHTAPLDLLSGVSPKTQGSPGKYSAVSPHISRSLQPYTRSRKSIDAHFGISTVLHESFGTVQSRLPSRMSTERPMGHAGELLRAKMISLAAGTEGRPYRASGGLPTSTDHSRRCSLDAMSK